jgi:hypothetical protein
MDKTDERHSQKDFKSTSSYLKDTSLKLNENDIEGKFNENDSSP